MEPPPPPPPPPPHGSNPSGGGRSGGLPDGRYDIFVIPPHSAGSGFLYLPSLQTQRNSFLAGAFCTAAAFFIYTIAVPAVKEWANNTIHGSGGGIFVVLCCVAVAAWAFGKTQSEWSQTTPPAGSGAGGSGGAQPGHGGYNFAGAFPNTSSPGAGAGTGANAHSWSRPQAQSKANPSTAKTSWEKAREETRKREDERRRTEELKKRREELEKERQRQRDKETRERQERERRERDAPPAPGRDKKPPPAAAPAPSASPKRPPMPSARTEQDDDAYSFRPYDRPKHKANSGASIYSESSSYHPSDSTARTTPPPSTQGPYATKDPDKIILKGVFSFNSAFNRTPISQLISGKGQVTDGLILRITTEGLFIDDDRRGVPQREWDVKAWTMKLAESCELGGLHVLRASIRDTEGKKFVFVLSQSEGWKVAVGLQRLRRGTQVRALGVAGLPQNEAKAILQSLGFV